jgi:predicted ATPase/signal transduction histidine kinase/GAF domain-containing protein
MTELSAYELSALLEGETILYRGRGDGQVPILLVMAAEEYASPASIQHLEHQYALRADLDANWAARPVELIRRDARPILVLEDPGGEPLERLLGRPLEIAPFLRIAVSLAAAIGQVHARGLIHKDLKPANILVDMASGGVWLTGFGIASRLPREHQAPAPPEVIAGTLAYMAPEQTGRMNRSVDSRSDLYSLGVTFYEMLTGARPFTASDPMEWVHCHIARQPVSPSERAAVPGPVSAIVMKLLAKTAEDRYQTAGGLTIDLRRCLMEWQATGRIEPFPLGVHDASDRLLIPERLYGRERETGAQLAAFDRVVASGMPELVLVSGYSGIGKSSVVNELHKALVPRRGLFATGKFDQYNRDIPYATLAQAFQSLVRPLLGQSEGALGRWRDALSEALGPNGQLIINLIPELELVIGKPPPVPELPPQDARNRFQTVFRRFLGVFARAEHPLALFLDDLQWLDTATLDLLEHLLTHAEVRHLLLVGAYRDNEVGPTHPLLRTLEAIRNAGAQVQEIVLGPLGLDDVARLVADALHCAPTRARDMAKLVHQKTSGSPFFAIQFLTALADEGLLAFDRSVPDWQWDIDRIRAKGYTDNVVDLMAGRLQRLSATTRKALQQLACLGNGARIGTLTLVRGEPEAATHAALWGAVQAGLVLQQEGAYKFLHDRIQQAAYSLIPEERRPDVHLRIGRVLLAGMTADDLDEHVFDVANLLNRGAGRLVDRDEKMQVATIDLRAGRKAKASAAYASARTYFAAGMTLLDERHWADAYDLMFSLGLERAECEYLTGNYDEAEELLSELLARGASKIDKAAAYRLKIDLHVVKSETPKSVESALECLRLFGIEIPTHPTREQVDAEYQKVWNHLGERPIESLIDLPLMTDPEMRAAMGVLAVLFAPTYSIDLNLVRLHLCHMVNVSMNYGTTDASAHAYCCFGTTLGSTFRRYIDGYRFGKLACDLVEKHGFLAYRARIYHSMEMVVVWTQPIGIAVDYIRAAFRASIESGELSIACYSCNHTITDLLTRGDHLDEVWRESERGLDFVRQARFRDVIDIIVTQQRFIENMRGRTANFSTFSDATFDEIAFEAQLTKDRMATMVAWYWILKLQARFISGDYKTAIAAARKAKALLWASDAHIQLLDYHYYSALTMAALYETVSADEQAGWRDLLTAHEVQLREWAETYPPTFGDKHALVSAELARLEGRVLDAERLYEVAIRQAHEHGFVQNDGLANELAARFYAARGFDTIASAYLRNARHSYLRWGAAGKVRQLEQSYPYLREESAPLRLTTTMEAPLAQFDLATVTKIYQAVSGEIVLEKLIGTLMVIAVEHAGAERGLLVLPQGDEQQIEAEARTGRDAVTVRLLGVPATPSELPDSILQYVIRTQDSVILDDASAQNTFSEDPYIRQQHARSVLCLPLIKQVKLIGTLYLENNLASHVFTPDRISVLRLLSSQAAISIENARLYAELINENRDRQQAEDRLRRSEESLAQAQQISHTGSWRWTVGTGEVHCSTELHRLLAFDPGTTPPAYATYVDRIHPEDRVSFGQVLNQAMRERSRFQHEYRIVLPDGTVRYVQSVGQPDNADSGSLEFVGTVMDISERREAEEALRDAQAELVRMARLTTMGELVASIAHEINQPLAAIAARGNAGLRWLNMDAPNVDAARETVSRIVRDAHRAGDVIRSLLALTKKTGPQLVEFDINDAIKEVLALTHNESPRHGIALHTNLSVEIRPIFGDRVQLQQVVLNLITNAIDAMGAVWDHAKELTVSSALNERGDLLVTITDTGVGLDPTIAERIFEPFFTTKSDGLGMGLSICRSIIEAHGGQLWVSPNVPHGTVFRFTVPGMSSA